MTEYPFRTFEIRGNHLQEMQTYMERNKSGTTN